jgi:hypothetical protein
MSGLIRETIHDLRWGRQSWRVRLLVGVPAIIAGLAVGLGG